MGEYTDKDIVKSLARAIELLVEENKELRKEIESLRAIPAIQFDSTSLCNRQEGLLSERHKQT